jgi:hypothetical protein
MAITVGVLVALGWLGWALPVSLFLVLSFAFWVFAFCLVDDVRARRRQLVEYGVTVPGLAVAFVGFWALVGGWAMVLTIALIGCHPWVVSRMRNSPSTEATSGSRGHPTQAAAAARPLSEHPARKGAPFGRPSRLSDESLRQCWEASWALLQRARTLPDAKRIVEYRQTCLDEIARRNPDTFPLWLEAGAPNAHEPARQLPSTFEVESSS